MTIRVHIDRLILDELPPSPLDTEQLSAAVSSELGRLVQNVGILPGLAEGGSFGTFRGPDLPPGPSGRLGTHIARALHGAIAAPRREP
jgi:hypothetical protein